MEAILIDIDVLCIYDEESALRAAHKAIKTKLMVSYDRFRKLYDISVDEVIYDSDIYNFALIFQRLIEKTHNRAEPALVLKVYRSFMDTFLSRLVPSAHAKVLIRLRKKGLIVGVLSDYSSDTTLEIISRTGIQTDCIVTNEEARHAMKFLLASSKMGVPSKDIVFVGNGAWDIHGANLAQMQTAVVSKGKLAPEFKGDSRPQMTIKKLSELENFL